MSQIYGTVPCIACGVNTSNPHCFCSDDCWDSYHADLHDPDVMADMYADMEAEALAHAQWEDDGGACPDYGDGYGGWDDGDASRYDDDSIPW